MTSRAFSLLELIVVCAILALLAAIIFPVFKSAKRAAAITATPNLIQLNVPESSMRTKNGSRFPYTARMGKGRVLGALPPWDCPKLDRFCSKSSRKRCGVTHAPTKGASLIGPAIFEGREPGWKRSMRLARKFLWFQLINARKATGVPTISFTLSSALAQGSQVHSSNEDRQAIRMP